VRDSEDFICISYFFKMMSMSLQQKILAGIELFSEVELF